MSQVAPASGVKSFATELNAIRDGEETGLAHHDASRSADEALVDSPSGKDLATPDRKIGNSVVQKGRMTDLRDAAAPRAAKSSVLIHIAVAATRRMMTGISAVWTLRGLALDHAKVGSH